MKNAAFITYIIARVCIGLSGSMLSVAIGWHLYQLTGDPFDLALVGLVQVIPMIALFMLTGWVVDHFPRKVILGICSIVETIVLLLLTLLMLNLRDPNTDKYYIFLLLFLHGCARAFYSPAQQAILPNIVSKAALSRAVAITSTAWNTAETSGPFIAGLLLAWLDYGIYAVLALSSFIAALLFFCLPVSSHVKPTEKGWRQVFQGIHFIKNSPIVLGCLSLDLFAVLFGSVIALLPVYAVDILKVGPEGLGFLRGMPALGAVMMGLAIAKLPPLRHAGNSLFIALVVFAASIIVFALSKNYWLSLIALWTYGASDMVSVNVRSTLIQLATPDSLRGRVSAVNFIFISMSNKLGDFRAGSVAALVSPVTTVALGGIMALAVAAGGYALFPSIRRLDRVSDAAVEEDI